MPRGYGRGYSGWQGRLRGCGYRMTSAREVIWDVLNKTSKHLSAEEIYISVHKGHPEVGLTTVYRTLEMLNHTGMVSKFDFGDGRARYELVENQKGEQVHHHHLICRGCKRVIDYTDFVDEELEFLKRTEKMLSKKYNFDIKGHIIHFYGLCDKCK